MATRAFSSAGTRRSAAALAVAAAVVLSACGGGSEESTEVTVRGVDTATAPARAPSRNATVAPTAAAGNLATAVVSPAPASTASTPPPATATPPPVATPTSVPPTPTATPTLNLSVQVVGECSFEPSLASMKLEGSVTFVNTTGSEIEVSIYFPNDAGVDGGGIEPGESSEPYEVNVTGRSTLTCDVADSAKTWFGALVVTG